MSLKYGIYIQHKFSHVVITTPTSSQILGQLFRSSVPSHLYDPACPFSIVRWQAMQYLTDFHHPRWVSIKPTTPGSFYTAEKPTTTLFVPCFHTGIQTSFLFGPTTKPSVIQTSQSYFPSNCRLLQKREPLLNQGFSTKIPAIPLILSSCTSSFHM